MKQKINYICPECGKIKNPKKVCSSNGKIIMQICTNCNSRVTVETKKRWFKW